MSEWNRGVRAGILIAASGAGTAVLMRLSIGLESIGEASIAAGLLLLWCLAAAIDRWWSRAAASIGVRTGWPNEAEHENQTAVLRTVSGVKLGELDVSPRTEVVNLPVELDDGSLGQISFHRTSKTDWRGRVVFAEPPGHRLRVIDGGRR